MLRLAGQVADGAWLNFVPVQRIDEVVAVIHEARTRPAGPPVGGWGWGGGGRGRSPTAKAGVAAGVADDRCRLGGEVRRERMRGDLAERVRARPVTTARVPARLRPGKGLTTLLTRGRPACPPPPPATPARWLLGESSLPAHIDPGRLALRWGSTDVTYGELRARSVRLAAGLRRSGLQVGDRVCTLLHNRGETFELYFASAYAGLTLVPINFRMVAPRWPSSSATATPGC